MTKTDDSKLKESMSLHERLNHPMANFIFLRSAVALLLGLGLVMVYSASSLFSYRINGDTWTLAVRQIIFALAGWFAMNAVSKFKVSTIRKWSNVLMLGSIGALVLVLVVGTSVNGQKNWIEFGPFFRVQPSEFAKLAIVIWGANQLAKKHDYLHYRKQLIMPVVPVCALILILVLKEGDLGTAMVMMPMMASILFFAGAPRIWFAWLATAAVLGIAVLSFAQPYRLDRFKSWIDPGADPRGTGFQVIHGQQALGSGGWFGLGLGGSREKWGTLPEAHTDFIYAVIGEELGILGTLSVIVLFLIIGILGFRIAQQATDPFVRLAAAGATTWISTQMLVNIGAVLGTLPITGVPLPLVSYGGSSLIPTLVAFGVLLSFARQQGQLEQEKLR